MHSRGRPWKRHTPKKRPKNTTPKLPTGPLSREELLKLYRKYYQAANKRIDRLIAYKEREGGSPYAEKYYTSTEEGILKYLRFGSITKLSWGQQVHEWVRLRDFMNAETSTIWGEENYRERQDKFLRDIGIGDIERWTAEEKTRFYDAYNEMMSIKDANFQYQGRGDRAYIMEFARIKTDTDYNWSTHNITDLTDGVKLLVAATSKEYAGNAVEAAELRRRASEILRGEGSRDGLEVYLI